MPIACKGTQNAVLHIDQNGTRCCRFHYPIDEIPVSYVKYNKVSNKASVSFKAKILAKRNDSRLNRHQELRLQWRGATTGIQLKIDQYASVEYVPKYASKAENISSVAREAFVHVINNLSEATAPESTKRQFILGCTGERDIAAQETMHQILGLKLYRSFFFRW